MVQGSRKKLSFIQFMKLFCFLIRQINRYIKCVVKLEAPKNPHGLYFSQVFMFKWTDIQQGLILEKLYVNKKYLWKMMSLQMGWIFFFEKCECFKKLNNAKWIFRVGNLFSNNMLPNYQHVMLSLGRRVQNPVKHLRWNDFPKPIFAKSSILVVW